jgi:hypothetical protein
MPPALACRQAAPQFRLEPRERPPSAARALLQSWIDGDILLEEDFQALPDAVQEELEQCEGTDLLLCALKGKGLLTEHQAARISAGKTFGLVLGNYRVLDRLGAGGMGVVFKAEHIDMRRVVAIKVLPVHADLDPILLRRFLAEVRAVGRLNHPNIVAAFDAGTAVSLDEDSPDLRYFVMEYVPGRDLEAQVRECGPLATASACDLAHQIASALAEAHKYNLVHRDIKPSNVLVTPEEQAKLLDFGLALRSGNRLTEPGTMLGTFDFMAPEQARDASAVDIRADIYGLGGTLFWCLTGQTPFPAQGSLVEDLARRLSSPPPSAQALRKDVPAELDAVITRMMALDHPPPPRTPRRHGLPGPAGGDRHSTGGAHRGHRRRLRRPALAAGVQARAVARHFPSCHDRGVARAIRPGALAGLPALCRPLRADLPRTGRLRTGFGQLPRLTRSQRRRRSARVS